jgi:hypothetical protein
MMQTITITPSVIKAINHFLKPTVMKKKPNLIKEKSWRRYTDIELSNEDQKFSMGMPNDNMAPYSSWTVRGLTNDEIVKWILEVRSNAPEFVYQGLIALVEKELAESRLEIIRNMMFKKMIAA